jgi:hypothetical protein
MFELYSLNQAGGKTIVARKSRLAGALCVLSLSMIVRKTMQFF